MTPQLHRTILPVIKASGRRRGAYRLITGINLQIDDPSSLEGESITPALQIDLPVRALIVSTTPTGSAHHHTIEWQYARVPLQDRSFTWSNPLPHRKFLDFRDTIAAEFFQLPQAPPTAPWTFLVLTEPRPQPSKVVTTAHQFQQALTTALADPGLTGLSYSWSTGGFAPEGIPARTTRVLLREASHFAAWALHKAPAFILPALAWQNQRLTATITQAEAFHASQGIPFLSIETLTQAPHLARHMNVMHRELQQFLPRLTTAAWEALEAVAAPHGFHLANTSDPSVKYLIS